MDQAAGTHPGPAAKASRRNIRGRVQCRGGQRPVIEVLKAQDEAGADIVSDGEQRRDNFYSYVVGKIAGMQLMKVSELLDYARDRARPGGATARPGRARLRHQKAPSSSTRFPPRKGCPWTNWPFSQASTPTSPSRFPIPGPYMLTRLQLV